MKRLICLVVFLGLVSQMAFAQRYTSRTYSAVGLIRKVIFESEDFSQSQESYMIQEESGRMVPISGNFDFDSVLEKKVVLTGTLNRRDSSVIVNSLQPLEKIREPKPVHPENLPRGETSYDLSTKEGTSEFQKAIATGGIILPPPTTGMRFTVVVPITFTNNTNLIFTRAQLESRLFNGTNSAAGFFSGASFGKFGINGVVLDPIAIPFTDADCASNMYNSWTQAALARIPPEIVTQSNNFVFMPAGIPTCSMSASSTVGVKGANLNDQYAWIQQDDYHASNLSDHISTITHELGHQFGLPHAQGISLSGVVCEYCDIADFMGSKLRYPASTIDSPWIGLMEKWL